ncbi:glycerate kinase [Advenella sp. S44]|uniref:glycerate kinase n=1 Tax=Advenella sp. S44 TaxID=1982755 RepID=UPI000C2B4FA5|nr:glycerate kinase [Advenella sp. S44]PJX26004.1 glycerate kinase [Advenella sp. S44]
MSEPLYIVIAPDSFKESLSSSGVAQAIADGIKKVAPDATLVLMPMADGGEGTVEAIASSTGASRQTLETVNALGEPTSAAWIMLQDNTAVIEMASAAGLEQIAEDQRDVRRASTYGVGQLVCAALDQGARRIVLGLGGSATNDGGAGLLNALGIRLLDKAGQPLAQGPAALYDLASIDLSDLDPRVADTEWLIASDVNNPLCGEHGASAIFGPQKGASPDDVRFLDAALSHFADMTAKATGHDVREQPGAGAAGGLGFAALAYLEATFKPGVEVVAEYAGLDEHVQQADLVITGEGRLDAQTLRGKTIAGIAALTQKHQVPLIALAGSLHEDYTQVYEGGITAAFSLPCGPMSLKDTMQQTRQLLIQRSRDIVAVFLAGRRGR